MSETICKSCKSAGPFTVTSEGRRCQQCGAVEAHPAPVKYSQPADPPGRASDPRKAHWKNPLGM